ncbi:hypothetical protein [Nocardia amamiensis]|uniref:hypothetical protein n=1 Tax=Nocardia amamiensis TaxID=404578 RepID=UPI000832523A|nr:hypothetical protein [Nocardia amamiensis]
MTLQSGPVVCAGYLALAELWNLPRFPAANHGAEIRAIEWSVAADGPMTAAALASLGAPSLLISNDIGEDEQGQHVRRWRSGWPMHRGMLLGSASGALRCARHQNAPLPTLAELQAFIASRPQSVAS